MYLYPHFDLYMSQDLSILQYIPKRWLFINSIDTGRKRERGKE